MKKLLISLLFFATVLKAAENWDPAKHPASLTSTVSSFTEPCRSLSLKAEYPGRLETFQIKEGTVLAGSDKRVLIAVQDSKLAAIEVDKAQAALKSEETLLLKRQSEKNILERELKYRLLELKRVEKLSKEGRVPQADFDKVRFDYDNASLKIKDVEAAVKVQQQVIAQRKVNLAKAEEDLQRYKVYGPKGWVLNERLAEPGTWLNAGETIAKLVDLRELSVFVRLSEEEMASIGKEQLLKVKRTGETIKARLHHVDLSFDPVSRKRLLEFRVKTADFPISSGTEVELALLVPYPKPAVMIPNAFIFRKLDQDYVKTSDGKELAVIPLRKNSDSIVVNKSSLPDKVILVKPAVK